MELRPFTFLICLLLFSDSLSGQVPGQNKFIPLDPSEFRRAYENDPNARLIDVRETYEYRKSRIQGAINMPSSGNLMITADTISRETSLFFYCTTGFRSRIVAENFSDRGFPKTYSLTGGIKAWEKAGMPLSRKKIRRNNTR